MRQFIDRHFHCFNARQVKHAANAWEKHTSAGGKMMLAMGGAMSTAGIGTTLTPMIHQGRVHAISCTGANLEEDLLRAMGGMVGVYDWHNFDEQDEKRLADNGLCRVLDTAISVSVMDKLRDILLPYWKDAASSGERYYPHEYIYQAIMWGDFDEFDMQDSWVYAACRRNVPLFVPGWEDSTMGNVVVGLAAKQEIQPPTAFIRGGLEYMNKLIFWYKQHSQNHKMGFFQIGGGIAGDFPICVVPLIREDMKEPVPHWEYFAQIGDSTTSYGSYSGALPREKITWDKLSVHSQMFHIESDATIVWPLICGYVLGDTM